MRAPEWWADEIASVAERAGVEERALAAVLPRGDEPDEPHDAAWDTPPETGDVARMFRRAASALDRAAASRNEAAARAQLVSLVVVGELIGAPSAAWWAMGHAERESLGDRVPRLAGTLRRAGEAIAAGAELGGIDLESIEREVEAGEAAPEVEGSEAAPEVEARGVPAPVVAAPRIVPPASAVGTAVASAPALARATRGGRARALIADDSAIAARFLERMLASRGVEVVCTSEASAARAALEGGEFDVVFWDRDLPGFGSDALLTSHPEWAPRTVLLADAGGARTRGGTVRTIVRPPAEEELDALSILPPRRAGGRADAG